MDYAVVRTGGKQYRVTPGLVFDVERLPAEVGSTVELTDILAVGRDGQVSIGTPVVAGAKVVAEVKAQDRDDKIISFKYHPKTHNRVKRGHRQQYTRLLVKEIAVSGEVPTGGTEAKEEVKPDGA